MRGRVAPTAPGRTAAQGSAAHPGLSEQGIGDLIDAIVELSPELARRRSVLPSVDWRQASPAQVARLSDLLAAAGMAIPPWLAADLLVAGHRLPADTVSHLPAATTALAALVGSGEGVPLPEPVRQGLADCAAAPPMDSAVAKAIVSRLAARGDDNLAVRIALAQWPHTADAWRALGTGAARHLDQLPSVRLRIASYSSTQLLAEALRPAFAANGHRAIVASAPYGSVMSSLLQPESEVDALLLLLDFDGLVAADWRSGPSRIREGFERGLGDLCDAAAQFCVRSGSPLFLNTLPVAALPSLGHADLLHEAGAAAMTGRANQRLAELAASTPLVQLVDADVALAAIAPRVRTEPKLWYFGRMAYSDEATRHLARAFAVAWTARKGGRAKVLALDFDNTLWGGVYGDDGIERLACGDDAPGNAYKALQTEALRLKSQGVLLVGLSKNNPDATSVFDRHAGMALRADDFVAFAVNWEPKPDNIRRIASELRLGLDSFLFVDDSPHERAAMRRMCPEVIVPEVPYDPALRPGWLRSLACTWPLRVTGEDARRSELYLAEAKAKALRASAVSYDEYLAGLEQRLTISPVGRSALPRVAQLHERTNQFNLTTRRLTEPELQALMADSDGHIILKGEVADRFGDHGLVVAAVVRMSGQTASIESFVMSCRVVARTIETAFLGAIIARLIGRGVETIEAAYLPTAKNGMVRDFYASNGFEPAGALDGGTLWCWRHERPRIPDAPFVAVHWSEQ